MTDADLFDGIKRARADRRAAEAERDRLKALCRDADKRVAELKRREERAIEEALAERRQPSLFDPPADPPADPEPAPASAPADPMPSGSPTWRSMAFTLTEFGADIGDDTAETIVHAGVATVGQLADRLLAGETFDLPPLDLGSVYGLVEQISEDDAEPIDFDKHFGPEPEAEPVAIPSPEAVLADPDSFQAQAALREKPATKLADLADFPVAVADALLPRGVSTVETLLASHAAYHRRVGSDGMLPLRSGLVAYLVADVGTKLKPAERAADAVAKFVEPPAAPDPDETRTTPDAAPPGGDQGLALVIRSDGAAALLKKLTKSGVRTVGELAAWVDRDFAADGGMADQNGTGLFAAFRSLGAAPRTASAAGDAVRSFLRAREKGLPAPAPRFTVEAGNEPFHADRPDEPVWFVVDTAKKVAHERYCDEYPSEAEARAAAGRYESEARSAPAPGVKPAKGKKRKAGAK
jgi:hypothetical protein